MAKTYPVIERNGGRVTVLARTAEEAHEAITNELGLGCTIVSVERVRSGGMGGFFATELVRLVAAPKGTERARIDRSSFASADDLVFALPGGGDQFAARLQQELAALTTKGIQAADATMNRPASANPAIAARSRPELVEADLEPRIARPAPIEIVTATTSSAFEDDPLPSTEELLWARDDDDTPRRWRRNRGRTTADDEFGAHLAPEHQLREDPAADAALLAVWNDIETAPSVETLASFDPEPVVYETTGTDPREGSGWDTTRTVPSGYDTPVEVPIEEHHALEQLLAEADLEDQIITPRARLIREGRARRDAADDAVDDRPFDPPAPIDLPVVDLSTYDDAPLEFPVMPALSPVMPPPADRPPLPVRNRVLVPSPVSLPTSWTAPTLRAFGVPDGIVDRMTAQAPSDDTEWTVAFMLSVRELCRSLPSGPSVLVGPSGANLARQLDLVSFSGDELGLSNASVASPNAGPLTLRRASGGRHVHLVVGGNWHHLVTVRPTIVSAATEHDLVEALRVAEAWGATLGWTLVGDRYVRVDPFLLAARIRELLPEPTEATNPFTPFA